MLKLASRVAVCAVVVLAWVAVAYPEPPHAGPVPPDVEYRLPDNELTPGRVVFMTDTGDVADWGLSSIGVSDAWRITKGKGAVVAVLDTGVDREHRDLKSQIKASRDFTGSRSGDSDVAGHGTHCAGVIAAAANGTGMVGVAPECQLLIGKVLGDKGSGGSTGIARGIDWATEQGADVISMSLGSSSPDPIIYAAIKRAAAKGVIVVVAAGNEGPGDGTVSYPGAYPEVVCVAAVDGKDNVAAFSSRGAQVLVAAPGVGVKSCYPGDRFATMSGTSMATPHVAGVAALYVADCKNRKVKPTAADFKDLLAKTSRDLAPPGRDHASGWGVVQAGKLVARPDTAPPPPVPAPQPDRLVMDFGDGVDFMGRKLRRIVYEFDPLPVPAPMPRGKP